MSSILDTAITLDSFKAPKQARSQQTVIRVLRAIERLLKDRPIDKISIQDIAREAECVPASIYARFRDKGAVVSALHEAFRSGVLAHLDDLLDPAKWVAKKPEAVVRTFCFDLVASYSENHNMLRAVLLLNDEETNGRIASMIAHIASKLGAALASAGADTARIGDQRMLSATLSAHALLQQNLLLGEAFRGRFDRHKAELDESLVHAFEGVSGMSQRFT